VFAAGVTSNDHRIDDFGEGNGWPNVADLLAVFESFAGMPMASVDFPDLDLLEIDFSDLSLLSFLGRSREKNPFSPPFFSRWAFVATAANASRAFLSFSCLARPEKDRAASMLDRRER
jgi:hypothetical protein